MKKFNVTGNCKPGIHYMVNISEQIQQIKEMIDEGNYFTINRARQYGKTTTLNILENALKDEYTVINLDFQFLSYASFETEEVFVKDFSMELLKYSSYLPDEIILQLKEFASSSSDHTLRALFLILSAWCNISEKR